MITLHFGSIPLGSSSLTGPKGHTIGRKATFAKYAVTRGKPVLHEVGEELDTQSFDFFFSEEFCNPQSELNKLELAYSLKTPLPLVFTAGGFFGQRYVVDALSVKILKTNRSGGVVRVEATISLTEAPLESLLGLLKSIAKSSAPALSKVAGTNPNVRR
jgi:hypothetical protein